MEEIIGKKYILREFIGKGKFGSVFKGEKIGDENKIVAIKLEPKNTNIPLLKKETRILEYLARNGVGNNIVNVFWYGLHQEYLCTVMSYLGETSLSTIEIPSLDFLINWFHTAISILEKVHLYGVIHRDLKPGHFMFYENKWKLIDFGFAVFISPDSLETRERKEWMIGTPNYVSVRVHDGLEPGKKDDMISLGYIFLEKYLGGKLPWSTIEKDSGDIDTYPLNHLLHSTNIFRRKKKERDCFFQDIIEIPLLLTYMQKYY